MNRPRDFNVIDNATKSVELEWKFDPVHNHWKTARFLISVAFNEKGTKHAFQLTVKGYSYGDYDLSGVPDREAGSFKTLKAAQARAKEMRDRNE